MSNEFHDHREPGFFLIDNEIFEFGLSTHELAVYFAIVQHANTATKKSYPGMKRIATMTKMSKRQVVRCIDTLESKGLVKVKREKDDSGQNKANRYYLQNVKALYRRTKGSDSESLGSDHQSPGSDSESPDLVTVSHSNKTKQNKTKEQDTPGDRPFDSQDRSTYPYIGDQPAMRIHMPAHSKYEDGAFIDVISPQFGYECESIFYAFRDALPDGSTPAPKAHWEKQKDAAVSLAKMRVAPGDVNAFVVAMYQDDFWKSQAKTLMSLQYVVSNIRLWLSKRKTEKIINMPIQPVFTAPDDDDAQPMTPEEQAEFDDYVNNLRRQMS